MISLKKKMKPKYMLVSKCKWREFQKPISLVFCSILAGIKAMMMMMAGARIITSPAQFVVCWTSELQEKERHRVGRHGLLIRDSG